jgi:hypothetical protein
MERAAAPPPASFAIGIRSFVNILAVVHGIAFGSIWVQAAGLFGHAGILPANLYFAAAKAQWGARAWFEIPSLCWIIGTGASIDILCGLGVALALLLLLGYARPLCLALLWVCYLSLASAGQDFYNFQWDSLLLECTLIAIFLVPWTLRPNRARYDPPRLARYLVWWLLFRLMFLSGAVKLASGDPTWRHLTALTFHYQTQPLPTPLAWYAQQFPVWFQKFSCAVMFALELGCPWCLAGPRKLRHGAAVCLAVLQVLIALTGNYAYFNLLSFGLCLTCLDDAWWARLVPGRWGRMEPRGLGPVPVGLPKSMALRWFAALTAGVTFFLSVASLSEGVGASPLVGDVARVVEPFRSFNTYGLFSVMTPERDELIFEGSNDRRDWRAYSLPYKPGDLARHPPWVAPYQPRLDWQLWFAALGPPEASPWVASLCDRLLQGDATILKLFGANPFPDHPPQYVRVVKYVYEFTDRAERARTGNWWRRTPVDFYIRLMSLPSAPP